MVASRDNASGTGLGTIATNTLRDLVVGLRVGAISLVASVSVAALIFSGPLSPHLARGIGMVLITAVVSGLLVVFSSSCVRSIAIPQGRIAPILAVMASVAAAAMPLSASIEDTFVTIAVMIALTTSLTGLFLIGLGLFRVGGLIRFLPFSGIGELLLKGKSISIETSLPISPEQDDSAASHAYRENYEQLRAGEAMTKLHRKYPQDPLPALRARRLARGATGVGIRLAEK